MEGEGFHVGALLSWGRVLTRACTKVLALLSGREWSSLGRDVGTGAPL